MKKSLVCPYCKNDMQMGTISGDRYALKWIPGEDSGLFSQFKKGIKLTKALEYNYVIVHYCEECQKMIIDLNNKVE